MKRKSTRTRTNTGKVIHRAHAVHKGEEENVNIVNIKHKGEYIDERIINLIAHLRRAVGAIRYEALDREAERMAKLS